MRTRKHQTSYVDYLLKIIVGAHQLEMASVSQQPIEAEVRKVAVVLHEGSEEEETLNQKYSTEEIQQYSLAQVEEELLLLFPSLKEKGLRLNIYYHDSFVGRVKLDGDADVHAALTAFSEESDLNFRTFHVYDVCLEPPWKRQRSNDEMDSCARPTKRRKKVEYSSSPGYI